MNNNSPKISIILPVYNADGYLNKCIDSILAQTYSDYEILLINDGSTDESGKICDEYASKDSRIRVFHKENGGVSSARQLGIEQANGLYSIHVDSDDWIELDMLEQMYKAISETNADLLIVDFFVNINKEQIYRSQQPTSLYSEQVLRDIIDGTLHGATWNKLIRHSLFKKQDISFPKEINHCEDVLMWVQMLQNSMKISYLPEAFYHYDYSSNQNSITRNYTRATYLHRCAFFEQLKTLLDSNIYSDLLEKINLDIKFEVFINNVFSSRELRQSFLESADYIRKSSYSFVDKCLMRLILLGCGKLAYCFYRIKLKL